MILKSMENISSSILEGGDKCDKSENHTSPPTWKHPLIIWGILSTKIMLSEFPHHNRGQVQALTSRLVAELEQREETAWT
jgi:hypothetical protein